MDTAVADRLVHADQPDADWHARYDTCASERDRIAAFPGLSVADRAEQVAQLRRQTFPVPNEALHAQASGGHPRRE
ncbi:lipase secretion chaperone [Ralstonia syzygii]|uniref:lipase secretion chaperone n=1 Tax=Ralstonia syzygii TaxID=28097 RepID=UPI0022B0863A|nr:lipase secretion chaperone [Ralstonia syzygii]